MSAQKRTSVRGSAIEPAPADATERRTRTPKPKAAETKGPSQIAARTEKLRSLYQDTMSEMRKINWPDSETTRNLTIVVIGISVFMGALLGAVDWTLVQVLGLF